jgi:colicin import membrane protein
VREDVLAAATAQHKEALTALEEKYQAADHASKAEAAQAEITALQDTVKEAEMATATAEQARSSTADASHAEMQELQQQLVQAQAAAAAAVKAKAEADEMAWMREMEAVKKAQANAKAKHEREMEDVAAEGKVAIADAIQTSARLTTQLAEAETAGTALRGELAEASQWKAEYSALEQVRVRGDGDAGIVPG